MFGHRSSRLVTHQARIAGWPSTAPITQGQSGRPIRSISTGVSSTSYIFPYTVASFPVPSSSCSLQSHLSSAQTHITPSLSDPCPKCPIQPSYGTITRKTSSCVQMDTHYTPRLLASKLVAFAEDPHPSVVADLCAGYGDLLLEAENTWPHADYVAVDIDRQSVQHLRRLRPTWRVGRCDLTNPLSRAHSSVLKRLGKHISLLLLNPPFSCRGSARLTAATADGPIHASTAMFFLVTSLTYLNHSGCAVAVLPTGVLHNQKDRAAWKYIHSRYSVSVADGPQPGVFPRSSASTAVVRISPHKTLPTLPLELGPITPTRREFITVQLTRGCQPLFRLRNQSTGTTLVHSTDLRDATVIFNGLRSDNVQRSIAGPAVLIPRVGQLTETKIAVLCSRSPVVLSDCVIGLGTRSLEDARELRKRLVDNFHLLNAQYVGTGAPFVTLDRLTKALSFLAIKIDDI